MGALPFAVLCAAGCAAILNMEEKELRTEDAAVADSPIDSVPSTAGPDASDVASGPPTDGGGDDTLGTSDVAGDSGDAVSDAIPDTSDAADATDALSSTDALSLDAMPDASDGAAPTDLIDDMESDTGRIRSPGRNGFWLWFDDGTDGGSLSPSSLPLLPTLNSPPRGTSLYAERLTGSGFNVWGAGMGFDLKDNYDGGTINLDGGTSKTQYDASGYSGITFFAKAGGAAGFLVRVNAPDKNTDPSGGVCTTCYDHFGTSISLTTTWQQFTIKWSSMTQKGFGTPHETAVAAANLYGLQFNISNGVTFDMWIDDISFVY
jgi:hypothetical protein